MTQCDEDNLNCSTSKFLTFLSFFFFSNWYQQLWDRAAAPFLRLCDPIVSLVFSLLSGGKCDKVAFSFPLLLCLTVSALGRSLSSCSWGKGGRWGGGLVGTQAIVLRGVTGRSDPKSMRKQLCCSKLYFCQAGSSERSCDIRNPKWEDR